MLLWNSLWEMNVGLASAAFNIAVFVAALAYGCLPPRASLVMLFVNNIVLLFVSIFVIEHFVRANNLIYDCNPRFVKGVEWALGHLCADLALMTVYPATGSRQEMLTRALMVGAFYLSLRLKLFIPYMALIIQDSMLTAIFNSANLFSGNSRAPHDNTVGVLLSKAILDILLSASAIEGAFRTGGWKAVVAWMLTAVAMFINLANAVKLFQYGSWEIGFRSTAPHLPNRIAGILGLFFPLT